MTPGSPLSWTRLDEAGWEAAADAFNRCYEGYLIPIRMEAAAMAARFAAEDIDAAASWIVTADGGPAALAFTARRGDSSRLAAFGVAPEWRRKGLARSTLDRVIDEARFRRDRSMELEVFAHNAPAVRLYEKAGFVGVDRLLGFDKAATAGNPPPSPLRRLHVAPLAALALDPHDAASLPWQLRPETLRRLPPPWQLLHDGEDAFAVADLSNEAAVPLRLLYSGPGSRSQGRARRLLGAIEQAAAGRPIRVAQLVPSMFLDLALSLGFTPLETMQLRMRRDFSSS